MIIFLSNNDMMLGVDWRRIFEEAKKSSLQQSFLFPFRYMWPTMALDCHSKSQYQYDSDKTWIN